MRAVDIKSRVNRLHRTLIEVKSRSEYANKMKVVLFFIVLVASTQALDNGLGLTPVSINYS